MNTTETGEKQENFTEWSTFSSTEVSPFFKSTPTYNNYTSKAIEINITSNVTSEINLNLTTEAWVKLPANSPDPLWFIILNYVQLSFTCVGFVANLFTLITLLLHKKVFSKIVLIILRHQSAIDALVCLVGSLLIVQPRNWTIGSGHFDLVVCHLWHSQTVYWFVYFVSVWNLVLYSGERFLCVVFPLKYAHFSRKEVRVAICCIYIAGGILLTPALFQARYTAEGNCESQYAFDGEIIEKIFFVYAIVAFFVYYVIPVTIFFLFFGLILKTLRTRQKETSMANSVVIDKASSSLTKTAITVTAIFIISVGIDHWYYVLGNTGVTQYQTNTPIQKVSMFLTVINSCANPFVYAILMPSYRQGVKKTFRCQRSQQSGVTDRNQTQAEESVVTYNTHL